MILVSDDRGVVSALLVVLIAVLVVVAGLAVYNVSRARTMTQATPTPYATTQPTPAPTPTPAATATPLPVSAADQAAILVAASNQCNSSAKTNYGATLDGTPRILGDSAMVGVHCTGYIGGYIDWLKMHNGNWTIVTTGQEPPSKATCEQYALPASWCQTK